MQQFAEINSTFSDHGKSVVTAVTTYVGRMGVAKKTKHTIIG